MNIQELNFLTPENLEKIDYDPFDKWRNNYDLSDIVPRKIKVYYTDREEVIIIGEADNNYIYWFSVSRIDDVSLNRKIFDCIYRLEPTLFSSEGYLIGETGYTYEQFDNFYYTYLSEADSIIPHYQRVKKLCRLREANGKYLKVMRYNLGVIQSHTSDPVKDYERIRQLHNLIKSENYLRCSDNGAIREMYKQLFNSCNDTYQAYMNVARGGV